MIVRRFIEVGFLFGLLSSEAGAQVPAQMMFRGGPNGQLTAPPSKVSVEQRCTIAGQATNALTGEPVKKANLRLTVASAPGQMSMWSGSGGPPSQQGYAVTTDAEGTFRIEGIEPGAYNLSGQRTGFLHSNYGAKGPRQMGTSITLSPSQNLTGLTLGMTPQAVLSGKVLDEDGEPSASTMIQVLGPVWQRGKKRYAPQQSTNTNDLGEFRLANLSPGRYYISAQHHSGFAGQPEPAAPSNGKPDVRPILTYYPGTPNLESATAVEVKAGQDLPGIDIRLQAAQTYHVRGHVTGVASEEGKQHGAVTIYPKSTIGMFMPGGQSQIKPDGSFDIAGIAPGSYNLVLMLMSGNIRSGGQQTVDVSSGDVNDVALATAAPFTVRGTIKVEGSPIAGGSAVDVSAIQPRIFPADMGFFRGPGQTKVEKDGSFTVENVTAGMYSINIPTPSNTYLKSVLNGQTDIKGSDLDLTGGAPSELQITLRYGAAELAGGVQSGQNSSAPVSAQILVVPEPLNPDNSGTRLSGTDTNGSFNVKQLPPGHYRAFAFAQFDSSQTQNPEILKQLASKGTEFEVKENERKQVNLPLIGADELNQLMAQTGAETQ